MTGGGGRMTVRWACFLHRFLASLGMTIEWGMLSLPLILSSLRPYSVIPSPYSVIPSEARNLWRKGFTINNYMDLVFVDPSLRSG